MIRDIPAGKWNMETSCPVTKGKALEAFLMLEGDGLVGAALVYYDGMEFVTESFSLFG